MAIFAGIALGFASEVEDDPNEHRWQINAFAGVRGRERLDLGTDGGTVTVRCAISAPDLPSLLSAEQSLYAYQRTGVAAELLGNMGEDYEAVVLTRIRRDGPIQPDIQNGWIRKLTLTFEYDT